MNKTKGTPLSEKLKERKGTRSYGFIKEHSERAERRLKEAFKKGEESIPIKYPSVILNYSKIMKRIWKEEFGKFEDE